MRVQLTKIALAAALGLDVLGATIIAAGIVKNEDVVGAGDRYNERGQSLAYYRAARGDVKDAQNVRDGFYIVGSLLLASGIGVHIWF